MGSGADIVRLEFGLGVTCGYAFLHGPEYRVIVVGALLDILEAAGCGLGGGTPLHAPKECYHLGSGAVVARFEGSVLITGGDAVLGSPIYGLEPEFLGIPDIRETVYGCGIKFLALRRRDADQDTDR